MNRGYRAREAAAKAKAESRKVDPETRAIRAVVLERREAILAGEQEAVEAKRQAEPDAILGVLRHASEDELAEFARRVGQMAPRVVADMASDLLRQRQRKGHVALVPTEIAQVAPDLAQEAPPASKASTSGRTQRRA